MSHIDSIDECILGELQANGRLTMKALAERVGLSSPAMIERVRRLEDRGVITGYRAVVAPDALGRPLTTVLMVRLDPSGDAAFDALVQGNPAIAESHRLTGQWTHLLRAHLSGMAELELLIDALRAAGAVCESSIVTSSPVAWREMKPTSPLDAEHIRAVRRGRPVEVEPNNAEGNSVQPHRTRGPGRPRTRRSPA